MADEESTARQANKAAVALLSVIAVLLGIWALKITRAVTVPLVLAIFLSMLIYPMQQWLCGHLPRRLQWMGLVLAMLLVVAVLAVGAGFIWFGVQLAAGKAPEYIDKLSQYWHSVSIWANRRGLAPDGNVMESLGLRQRALAMVGFIAESLWSVLVLLVMVLFFTLLVLLEARDWRAKAYRAFGDKLGEEITLTLDTVGTRIQRWLMIRTAISMMSGVSEGIWFYILGVDFALLWGFLFFALNFIPVLGSAIASVPPLLLCLLKFGPWRTLLALAVLLFLEQVIGNFLDPRLQGKNLRLSPAVLLLGLVFWSWVWGIAGAFLAVPLTVSMAIVVARIKPLRPLAFLLAETADGPPIGLDGPDSEPEGHKA